MSAAMVSQIERRKIEAELLDRVRRVFEPELGPRQTLDLLRRVSDISAREAGAAFAAQAPGGPSLAHFATILERWSQGNALDIKNVRLTGDELTFEVTRCAYAEAYREMGLSPDMADIASCCRDFGFAEGYSPKLRLERPETIAQGASQCRFLFRLSPE